MTRLGDIIKARREALGLSLREFAEKCNLSHSYIKNLEDGDPRTGKDIMPTLNSLEKLAPVLGMTVEEMLKEIGFIQQSGGGFEPSNLKLIRGDKSYEELCEEVKRKTGEKIAPSVYEALEKGQEANPSSFIINLLAKYANVDASFFYRKKTAKVEESPRNTPDIQYTAREEAAPCIQEDLLEFALNPENEEYIRLAKELHDKNIKVKFIRDVLFNS